MRPSIGSDLTIFLPKYRCASCFQSSGLPVAVRSREVRYQSYVGLGGYDPSSGPHIAGSFAQKRLFRLDQALVRKDGIEPSSPSLISSANVRAGRVATYATRAFSVVFSVLRLILSKTYDLCNRFSQDSLPYPRTLHHASAWVCRSSMYLMTGSWSTSASPPVIDPLSLISQRAHGAVFRR